MKSLSGKGILITGASGGLGTVMSRAFAQRGTKLALVAWPGVGLEPLREELLPQNPNVIAMAADLRISAERRRVVEETQRQFGQIDILINNAGVELTAPYHEASEEDVLNVVSINLEAAMALTRLVLPSMLKTGGHIVNVSSLAGKAGPAYEEAYAASKAGLIAFTTSLRGTYKGTGVSASSIVPGFVEAGIYEDLKKRSGYSAPATLGTSSADKVARAVIRAILKNRPEIIINPIPVRPLLAIIALCPSLGEWLVEKLGTNDFFRRVAAALNKPENN